MIKDSSEINSGSCFDGFLHLNDCSHIFEIPESNNQLESRSILYARVTFGDVTTTSRDSEAGGEWWWISNRTLDMKFISME
jgi:hypothetical protein